MANELTDEKAAEGRAAVIGEAALRLLVKVHNAASYSTVYIAGSGYDFEEFAVPFAKHFSISLAGVACVWSHQCDFGLTDTIPFFTLPQVYVEPAATFDPIVIYCQSLISDAEEVSLGLRAVFKQVTPSRIVVVADKIADLAAYGLESGDEGYRAEVISSGRPTFGREFRNWKGEFLTALDDRAVKPGPLMSDWLIDRITRPKLDFTPTPVPPRHPPAGRAKQVPKENPPNKETGLVFSLG
ncbi:hypothetical protein [Rhizobium mongolense]